MRLHKSFYLWSYFGAGGGGSLLLVFSLFFLLARSEKYDFAAKMLGTLLLLAGAGLAIYSTVIMFVFIYLMWTAIQRVHPRTTPGKAVGYLFIPVFNIYWSYVVWCGFAKDLNKYIAAHELSTPRVSEDLAGTAWFCTVLAIIPKIGVWPGLLGLVLLGALISQVCDSVNSLPEPKFPPPPYAPTSMTMEESGGDI